MTIEQSTPIAAEEKNLQLVALSPGDMPATQQALSGWCDEKQNALDAELADLNEHLLIAQSNGWKLAGLQASINRTERRLAYYQKVKDAVDAGFLIVPNFPVTLLAVRVREDATCPRKRTEASYEHSSAFNAKSELLASGEGRYVDERLFTSDRSHQEDDGKGGKRMVRRFVSEHFDEPDFPFAMVKPTVLAATERAMALRIFDTIGMVENRSGRDPIMVGQILDPRGNDRRTTFFIAWWLNTRDL